MITMEITREEAIKILEARGRKREGKRPMLLCFACFAMAFIAIIVLSTFTNINELGQLVAAIAVAGPGLYGLFTSNARAERWARAEISKYNELPYPLDKPVLKKRHRKASA